jgi:hypothetical protein
MSIFSNFLVFLTLISAPSLANAQGTPSFGPETDVTINGLTFDAMEPFISADGMYLFFNNINDGVDTKLFYATRVNDSVFNFTGEVNGANQAPAAMLLDAVADMDTLNNFYWTSNRDYPAELDNLMHGTFSSGSVSNIGHVHGDFNMGIPGWLIMDHGVSYDGQLMYVSNARFDGVCLGPCETLLSVAQKVNDSTFMTLQNSAALVATINDTNYNYYAPCISSNNLELYYTRYPRAALPPNILFEICVATRNSPTDNFSAPVVLFSELLADVIEATTLTKNMEIMYYHRSIPGTHKIVMRRRLNFVNLPDLLLIAPGIKIYPNPVKDKLRVELINSNNADYSFHIIDAAGRIVMKSTAVFKEKYELDVSTLKKGKYSIQLIQSGALVNTESFIKK